MCFELYECASCGAVFSEPYIYRISEDMNGDGAWYTWVVLECPYCFSEQVSEYEEEEEDDENDA